MLEITLRLKINNVTFTQKLTKAQVEKVLAGEPIRLSTESPTIRGKREQRTLSPIQKKTKGWLPTATMPLRTRVTIKSSTGLERIAVGRHRNADGRVFCSSRDRKTVSDLVAIAWKPFNNNGEK